MYLDAEEEETDDSDDVVVVDNEIVEAQRPQNDVNERGIEKSAVIHLGYHNPNEQYSFENTAVPAVNNVRDLGVLVSSDHRDPDPQVERQITNLAKVCKLFPDGNLETIRGILDACNYDTKIAVTRLNEIKRINEMKGGDTFVPNFVPIDEQKAPKRKINSPGIEIGPQMKQTKSLPESSGVVPKRHIPEDVESRIVTILDKFPQANDRAIRHRLEESTDLDTVVMEVLLELGNSDKMEENPGPSKVKIDGKMEEHLSNEEKENLVHVTQIFPDVDPNFVFEQIAIERRTLEDIVNRMTNDSNYPKLKQRLEKERQERRRQEFLNSEQFDIEAYLHLFEEPESYFNDQTRNTTDLYVRHAMVHLMNSFRNIREEFLQRQLGSHNNHLLPTYRTITEGISQTGADGRRKKPRNFGMPVYNGELREVTPWPEDIDEMFFRELQYLQHEHQIREFIAERNGQREQREHEAKVNGQLIECQCCFIDNKLPEDMIACQQNHAFCRGCIRQHAETQVAQGFHRVTCMSDECSAEHDIRMLQNLLRPVSMDLLLRRRQQDELRNAQLDNMESCPFCDFAMIIENNDEKVFKCQNPNCLRESCRQCKEPNHIPKRCNEVIKDAEIRMRTYVENKMAEAWIRICPKCNKRIIKTTGCNALRCPCGTTICYVCNEELHGPHGSGHFDAGLAFFMGRGRDNNAANKCPCPPYSDMNELHADVAERAGKEARAMYLKTNPEVEEKAKIDDQHIEQLVDRDANNERRGAGHMYRVLMGDRFGARIGEQIGEQLARLGEQFVMRNREVRPGLAGVAEFDVPHFGEAFQVFHRVDDADNHQHPQEREMRRHPLIEHRHADVNRGRERQQADARRRIHEIHRQRRQLRTDIDKYEMQMHRLERATERHNMTFKPIDQQNNFETIRRSRDEALHNLELLDRQQAQAITELNRAREQLNEQEHVEFRVDLDFPVELEPEEEQWFHGIQQRERNQHLLNEQQVMADHLRRLHPQLTQVYGEVELLGQLLSNEDTNEQRQLDQFHNTQNNIVDRLNQHLMRDPAQINEVVEQETRELVAEINAHLNEMRQFMSRVSSHPVTKSTEASSSTTNSAAGSGGNDVTKTSIESVQKKMKPIYEALQALPDGSPDEARKLKREALQNLSQQLRELKRKATGQEERGGDTLKFKSVVKGQSTEPAAATPVAEQLGSSGCTEKRIKHLKALNEKIHVLDNQLKDAQRKMNKGMPDGQSVKQLMKQRDGAITDRNGFEAALLRDGIEEQQLHRNDGQYELTHAENAEAICLARNAVARREPTHAIQPALRIQFQHGDGQVHIVDGAQRGGAVQVGAGVQIRDPVHLGMEGGRVVHILPGDDGRGRLHNRPSLRILPQLPQQELVLVPMQNADIRNTKHGKEQSIKHMSNHTTASFAAAASRKQEASSVVDDHSYGKAENQSAAILEARQAIIHAQEMREEQMLNEHDRLNQEARTIQQQMEELRQREAQVQEQMAISEQRLAQSREHHFREMDRLNGQVHEMQINSPIQSQEASTVAAIGDSPPLQSVEEQCQQIESAWDDPPIPQKHKGYNGRHAYAGWKDIPEKPWAYHTMTHHNDTPIGRQNVDEPPARQQQQLSNVFDGGEPTHNHGPVTAINELPTLRQANLDAWASYSGASSDPPNRRQVNLDAWATYSGSNQESLALSQGQKNLEAWQKYSDTINNYAAQRPTNLDAWVPYGVGWNGPPAGPQTHPHGWNTWEPPNTERVVSLYTPYVPSRSPVSSEKGKSTQSGETAGQPKPEGSRGSRIPWNLVKLDHGQSSSSRESKNEQTLPAVVPMETDEPQSTVVLIEEDDKTNSPVTDIAEIEDVGSKKKYINIIVERVKESIPNVERQEVVNALLKLRESMGGDFGKQQLSELVKFVVLELKPVCSVIPSSRNSANLSNVSTSQSAPSVIHIDTGDQNQETVMVQQTLTTPVQTDASQNLLPKIESQNTESARASMESDDSTFTMRIGRDGNLNINIQLPKTQSQESSHSRRNRQENQSITQSESDQSIRDVNLETKTDSGEVDFADFDNESQI